MGCIVRTLDFSLPRCLVDHHPYPPLGDVLRRITSWEQPDGIFRQALNPLLQIWDHRLRYNDIPVLSGLRPTGMNVDDAFDCINIFKFGGDQFLDSHPSTEEELDSDSVPLGFHLIDQLSEVIDTDEFCDGHDRYVALHYMYDFR